MPNVKVYSTPTCPYCKMTKEFLKSHSISFEDIDVSTNQQAMVEVMQKSGQMGVPQIDIDGQVIVGFDQTALSQVLGINS